MSTASNDWWGYFGSYLLGKENLVLDKGSVLQIKEIINNQENSILYKLKTSSICIFLTVFILFL